jgi:hypothetical protein
MSSDDETPEAQAPAAPAPYDEAEVELALIDTTNLSTLRASTLVRLIAQCQVSIDRDPTAWRGTTSKAVSRRRTLRKLEDAFDDRFQDLRNAIDESRDEYRRDVNDDD